MSLISMLLSYDTEIVMTPTCWGVEESEITDTRDLAQGDPRETVPVVIISFSFCIEIHSSVKIDLT